MEKKFKWYASPQITRPFLRKLKFGLNAHVFTENSARGFLITSSRDDSVSGSFIERISGKRLIPDPFGKTIELPYVTFETINFRLSSVFPQIELVDAPRNTKRLYIAIDDIVRETFSVEPVKWDVVKALEEMSSFVSDIQVSEAHFMGVTTNHGLVSDIVFYGSGDVRAGALMEMKGKSQRLGTAKGAFKFRDREYRFDMNASSGVKLKRGPDDRLVVHFRALVTKIGSAGTITDA